MTKLAAFKMKAVLENIPRAMTCVRETAEAAGLDDRALYQIELAVDEACANIVQHAYQGMEQGDIEISCYQEERNFVIRIRDWGQGFEPEAVPDPDVEAPLEDRSLGGLGLFLIRQFMDEVQFTFNPVEGNELVMVKGLGGE
jgi:anti-sigma regulatory factor (Ser/Thr protein kinase)